MLTRVHDDRPDVRRLAAGGEGALPVALTIGVLCVAFLVAYRPISDPDTFWHLRLGQYVLDGGSFVGPEPWSSVATRDLVLHEWLLEVVYVRVFDLFGWAGLAWLQAAGQAALALTLYLTARRLTTAPTAALLAAVGWFAASGTVALRPQLGTYLLLAVTTTAWLLSTRDGRVRWWLVPLTYLWACVHAMWFVGPVTGAVVVAGMALDRRWPKRRLVHLAAVPVASVVVVAATPLGLRIFTTASSMRPYTEYVTEWWSPSLSMPQLVAALLLAAVTAVVLARRPTAPSWAVIGVYAMGVGASLLAVRTVAAGAVILTVVTAGALSGGVRPPGVARREIVALLVGVAVVTSALPALSATDVGRPTGVPTGLSPALDALPQGTVVLNDYVVGGWMLWEHPDLDPVVDGRADIYPVDLVADMYDLTLGLPGWQDTVRRLDAPYALLADTSPVVDAMEQELGWRVVAAEDGYRLLEAPR